MRDREREIHILRSDNGETWHEHTVEVTEDLIHETLNGSFEGEGDCSRHVCVGACAAGKNPFLFILIFR